MACKVVPFSGTRKARRIAELKARLTPERLARAHAVDAELHAGGRCTCGGEGQCDWCKRTCVLCGGRASAIHQCPDFETYAEPGAFDATPPTEDGLRELMTRIAAPFPPPDFVNGYPLTVDDPRAWPAKTSSPLDDLRGAFDRFTADMLFGPRSYVFTRAQVATLRDVALDGGDARAAAEAMAILDNGETNGRS